MTAPGTVWRLLDGVPTAWFDAPSLVAAAALAGRVVQAVPGAAVDVRACGVQVRLPQAGSGADPVATVSAAARDLDLSADPAALQQVAVVVETDDAAAVRAFWQQVLGYAPEGDGGLADPWRRDPPLRIRPSGEARPLRQRLHLDVVRPEAQVEQVRPGEPRGPYGVCHADPDGNEVDLLPGGPLGEDPATADWQAVFGAVTCYRTSSPAQQRDLAAAAAALADDAGFPLLVDLRPGLVVLDSGKDQWEDDAHPPGLDVTALAGALQAAARDLGATADPALPRFVQLFLDAADVAAVRAFWRAVLGYTDDPRPGLTDLYDPRRLGPVLVFQELDATDVARRRQRNRMHVELAVPADHARERLDAAVAAGGRLLDAPDGRHRIEDPEGNELVLVAGG